METITHVLSHNIGKPVEVMMLSGPYAAVGTVIKVGKEILVLETKNSVCHIRIEHIVNVIIPK